jgi:GT2 family glycosyltransferase
VDLSVLISTRNRAPELERTLCSLQRQELRGLSAEVVVVDNGSSDDTASVLRRPWPNLNLIPLYEEVAGKSRALNRALETIHGDLLIFTDDDITAGPNWLGELHRASVRFPSAHIFCGPIIPSFPDDAPAWFRTHPRAGAFFGLFKPLADEGPLGKLPFGANFAVRREAASGMRFRVDLGPSSENGALLGEDTEFAFRICAKGSPCIYVPSAGVSHHIAPCQIQPAAIFERAFHLGRTREVLRRTTTLVGDDRETHTAPRDLDPIELGGLLNFYCGELAACRGSDTPIEHELKETLEQFGIEAHRDLLGESASRYLAGYLS